MFLRIVRFVSSMESLSNNLFYHDNEIQTSVQVQVESENRYGLWTKGKKYANKNLILSSFKSSGGIQKKEGGPDSCFG